MIDFAPIIPLTDLGWRTSSARNAPFTDDAKRLAFEIWVMSDGLMGDTRDVLEREHGLVVDVDTLRTWRDTEGWRIQLRQEMADQAPDVYAATVAGLITLQPKVQQALAKAINRIVAKLDHTDASKPDVDMVRLGAEVTGLLAHADDRRVLMPAVESDRALLAGKSQEELAREVARRIQADRDGSSS